ncbi:Branched-chain-amino-acid aminotransferase [Cardiosporidium cionae]|uniref:Branched-chain-amino-acid aminotransferase n=1 Tax=Cardiosporidium cionae TaxID=476202 RepID=A0ABQ7J7G6_9APIC|nr:Branched-chain-amino-acid aminotransferase [Cardiosporidium cionae]|eukprot:KAF8819922.1 Branched-chain-amino-acid aminotransferase [Cardiosporidium cionae]
MTSTRAILAINAVATRALRQAFCGCWHSINGGRNNFCKEGYLAMATVSPFSSLAKPSVMESSSFETNHALKMEEMPSPRLPAKLNAESLVVIPSLKSQLSTMPPLTELRFGRYFTDHMLTINWDIQNGWHYPIISTLEPLSLHPACTALHYGLEIFEGLKGFKTKNGKVILFRPDQNLKRMNRSAARMALPTFDEDQMLILIKKLVELDKEWIPQEEGFSLYIRPCLFSTHCSLGVDVPSSAKLVVILSPCGPYYKNGFNPIQLHAETKFSRAYPGSVGDCKVGGNYGPTVSVQGSAAKKGYSQILWLHPSGEDFKLTEAGTMNLFVHWVTPEGKKQLITPPVRDNLILPGITRDAIIKLTQEGGEIEVIEGEILMRRDFLKAHKEDRLLEVFGAGTAAVVSPIKSIGFEGNEYILPVNKEKPDEMIGPLGKRLVTQLYDIQYGRAPHEWAVEI